MSLQSWYVRRGRVDRPTFWLRYALPIGAVLVVAATIVLALFGERTGPGRIEVTGAPVFVLVAVWLALLTPGLTSAIGRLNDTGRSGWWVLIGFVPFGGIVLLVFWCLAGEPGPNRFGPPPGAPQGGPAAPFGPQGYQQPGWGQQPPGPQGYGQQ